MIYRTINLNDIISTLKRCLMFLYCVSLQMMNTSASLNKKESYDPVDAGTTPAIIFLCILMAIGTIANGHVFGIFLFRYNRKSTYVTFVLALALIDLVVCVCDIPLEILDLMYPYDFYSETGCKLFKLMSATLSLSSIFTLALLSRERFKRVCYPLKPQWTNTMCRRYIAGGMVLSFLISAPVLYVHGLRRVKVADDSFVHTCFFDDDADEDWNPPLVHLSFLYLIFVVCLFLLIISYTCIGISLYRRRSLLYRRDQPVQSSISYIRTDVHSGSKNLTSSFSDVSDNHTLIMLNSRENYKSSSGSVNIKNIAEERRFTSSEKDNKSSPVRQEMAGIQLVSTGKNPPRNSHRSTIIPFIITAIFIVVFLPYLILGVFLCLKENFKANMTTTELSLYRLAMRLIFVNNVVNCFVYGIFDSRFQTALKEVYRSAFLQLKSSLA